MIKSKLRLSKYFLKETQPVIQPQSMADFTPQIPKQVSLDQAVDKYLVRYEREAIPTSDVYESANYKTLIQYLFEQDEEEEEEPAEEEEGGGFDFGGDAPAAEGDAPPAEPVEAPEEGATESEAPVVHTPRINLNEFTRAAARLVQNFDTLLDPKTIILNRIEAFLTNNYSEATAREAMTILDSTYGLKPVENTTSSEDTPDTPTPIMAGAGGSGG